MPRMLLAVLFLALPVSAVQADDTSDLVAEGLRLYEWLCMDCHAPGATGDTGSDIRGEDMDNILSQIENQDEMQGLPVDEDRARALEAYLVSLNPAL